MRLYFMVVRRVPPVPSPVLLEVYDILRGRGYDVSDGIAEEQVQRLDYMEPEYDLYLLKSHTEVSLSLAGLLHARGAWMLNPYLSCATTQNKVIAARILRAAGIPTPDTWVMGDSTLLEPLLEEHPLFIKPYMGHRGAGVALVHTAEELAAATAGVDYPLLAQKYIPGPGEDLKVYCVGDQVFAVKKPFSSTSFAVPGEPVPVTPEVRDISVRTGIALGLGLYGLDIIESPDGPVVVDVNYFPGYKGVPNAAAVIADYIDDFASGRTTLTPPEPASRAAAAEA
jgi:ribosomal protein S6--L-glutamate ligase